MRLFPLLFLLLCSCASDFKPNSTNTANAYIEQGVSEGTICKDDVPKLRAKYDSLKLPSASAADASAIQRRIATEKRALGDECHINKAYNSGLIGASQYFSLIMNHKDTLRREKIAKKQQAAASMLALSAGLNNAAASMNQSTALINQSTANTLRYNNYSTPIYRSPLTYGTTSYYTPPRTVNRYPTYGGGYTGTIR